jgi:hypothetical protein
MKAISLDKNNETIFTILNQLDIELLAQKIVKLPNYDINNFQTFFDYKEIFISERSNLTILRNLLSEHIEKSETRKLSLVLIEELIEKIDEYIKKIETNSDSYS